MKKQPFFITTVMILLLGVTSCNNPVDLPPTLTLTPSSITIYSSTQIEQITVAGTATGAVTLTDNLPAGITATFYEEIITVVVCPTVQNDINGNYRVYVSRQGVTEFFTVNVNIIPTDFDYKIETFTIGETQFVQLAPGSLASAALSTTTLTWVNPPGTPAPAPTVNFRVSGVGGSLASTAFTLDPITGIVTVNNDFTEGTVIIEGFLTGNTGGIYGSTVSGNQAVITFNAHGLALGESSVTINNLNLMSTVTITGAAGGVTFTGASLPSGISINHVNGTIRVEVESFPAVHINDTFNVIVKHPQGTANLQVIVDLTPMPTRQQFWVFRPGMFSPFGRINADLIAQGRYISIWVEQGHNHITLSAARELAAFHDNYIHYQLIDTFGLRDVLGTGMNIMEIADDWGNGDGRFCVLLASLPSGIGGYFWDIHFDANNPNSNQRDMVVMNAHPAFLDHFGGLNGDTFRNILAHEVQHLMNYAASLELSYYVGGPGGNVIPQMDIWLNESLSEAAGKIATGVHDQGRIDWYNTSETIPLGNNFFAWGSRGGNAILDDYATAYLFSQWLRIHAGGTHVFAYIYQEYFLRHPRNTAIVSAAANRAIPHQGFNSWEVLLRTWHVANFVGAPSGIFGYKGEIDVQARIINSTAQQTNLRPGEGVFSPTPDPIRFFPSFNTQNNIRYAAIRTGTNPEISTTAVFAEPGAVLLSFNVNPNHAGSAVAATITGINYLTGINSLAGNMIPARALPDKPFIISLRDMLRLQGQEHLFENNARLPTPGRRR